MAAAEAPSLDPADYCRRIKVASARLKLIRRLNTAQ